VIEVRERLRPSEVAKFTAMVALSAIFIDAAIGHGLTWENDPYWTYWVTKTFLIATVFGLGTAWFGIGAGRGAVMTAVHTLVLTVYYWSLSPIGLPSTPTWLDLEHTWVSGVPIHFAVIYAGYLLALWSWRRRAWLADADASSASLGTRALVVGLVIVVVAGALSSLAIGEFPGLTWFVVRLLLTVPFLIVWWGLFGVDVLASVVGAVVLALMWATYGQFVGPSGLPDLPLRLFDPAPPPATVRWLDYRELWLISLPIYLLVSLAALVVTSRWISRERADVRRTLAAAAVLPIVLFTTGLTVQPAARGVSATFSASGDVTLEDGGAGSGEIQVRVTDMGNRVTPLPPHDRVQIDATFDDRGRSYDLVVRRAMVEDPTGTSTTWWGAAYNVDHVGEGGEAYRAKLAAYGLGELTVDGTTIASGLPVEVIAADEVGLELEVGNEAMPIPGDGPPQLIVTWPSFLGSAPSGVAIAHYLGGGVVLLVLLGLGLLLDRAETERAERFTAA
jgi:hypothetical protein